MSNFLLFDVDYFVSSFFAFRMTFKLISSQSFFSFYLSLATRRKVSDAYLIVEPVKRTKLFLDNAEFSEHGLPANFMACPATGSKSPIVTATFHESAQYLRHAIFDF